MTYIVEIVDPIYEFTLLFVKLLAMLATIVNLCDYFFVY